MNRHRCLLILLLVFTPLLAGCGGDKSALAVKEARVLLPLGKPQEALDKLSEATSAEGLYLKAVALYNLQLNDAGREQVQKAVNADPNNPKYRAFQLRNQILTDKGKGTAADDLLKIYADNKSSSAICLFAATAFGAKGNDRGAVEAFQTAVALSDEAPEFLPEMLIYALRIQLGQEAKTLLTKLEKLGPGDALLARQRIAVLILVNEHAAAIEAAAKLYDSENQSQDTAMLYARALTAAPATPERDKAVEAILKKFPHHDELLAMFTVYLAKSNRMYHAMNFINDAIIKQPKGKDTRALVNVAVDLPLEAGDADLAEKQLELHKSALVPPSLFGFYQARVYYLKQDYEKAVAEFVQVLEAGRENDPIKRAIALRAELWLRQVQFDQRVMERLRKATEDAKDSTGQEKK